MNDEKTPATADRPIAAPTHVPSLWELFIGFMVVAVSAFGGVLPFARRMVVERRRWLTGPEFTNLLALGQFLPGPNIVNVSVCIGQRFHGWRGAVVAVLGMLAAPSAVVLVLGVLFQSYGEIPEIRKAVLGMAAAAAGLVIATGIKMVGPMRTKVWALVIIAAVAGAIAILRWPLFHVLLLAVPLAVVCAWYEQSHANRADQSA